MKTMYVNIYDVKHSECKKHLKEGLFIVLFAGLLSCRVICLTTLSVLRCYYKHDVKLYQRNAMVYDDRSI